MGCQSGKVCHLQESKPKVLRVGARIPCNGAPFAVAHKLQNTTETESDAIIEDSHRLRPQDMCVPSRRLVNIVAANGHMGDIPAQRDLGIVQEACGWNRLSHRMKM